MNEEFLKTAVYTGDENTMGVHFTMSCEDRSAHIKPKKVLVLLNRDVH